jgi:hypothetical protein
MMMRRFSNLRQSSLSFIYAMIATNFATNAALKSQSEIQFGLVNNINGPAIALFFLYHKSVSLTAFAEDSVTLRDADTADRMQGSSTCLA